MLKVLVERQLKKMGITKGSLEAHIIANEGSSIQFNLLLDTGTDNHNVLTVISEVLSIEMAAIIAANRISKKQHSMIQTKIDDFAKKPFIEIITKREPHLAVWALARHQWHIPLNKLPNHSLSSKSLLTRLRDTYLNHCEAIHWSCLGSPVLGFLYFSEKGQILEFNKDGSFKTFSQTKSTNDELHRVTRPYAS